MILDEDAAMLYTRVLIAVARADGEIDPDEALALERVVAQRAAVPLSLAELMFAPPVRPEALARGVTGSELGGGPFRSAAVDVVEIARTLIEDALAIVLVKGGVSASEETALVRFATALGLPSTEVRARIAAGARSPSGGSSVER